MRTIYLNFFSIFFHSDDVIQLGGMVSIHNPFIFLIKNIFVTLLFIHQIWNIKSAECLHTFQGGIGGSAGGVRCNSVHIQPRQPDHFILCNKSSTIFVMNLQGQV